MNSSGKANQASLGKAGSEAKNIKVLPWLKSQSQVGMSFWKLLVVQTVC
jgi:hypothetical protein